MDPRVVSWVLDATGGASLGGQEGGVIRGVSTDSRTTREDDLFVALAGERTDGHDHVVEAFRKGARAALVSRDVPGLSEFADRAVIRVADVKAALGMVAAKYRRELPVRIVAVTGSNGKTSTKDLIATVLEAAGTVVKSEKSLNNDIGVPLTLLAMGESTKFGVVEMGTNHPGEIAALCRIAAPDVGVVTNVAPAHLEGLGTIDDVAEEKGALVAAPPEEGIAFVNGDDFRCRGMDRRARCPVARGGFAYPAEVWGGRRVRKENGISFHLYGKVTITLPFPGLHNATNALLAAGVALWAGIPASTIRDRLATARAPEMRLTTERVEGVTIVNDAYNANPGSVAAAIEELEAAKVTGRRILVLGEMGELGEKSAELHRAVGRKAGLAGIHTVWAVGGRAADVEAGLTSAEEWVGHFFSSASTEEAAARLPFEIEAGDMVLVKGSRRLKLEKVVAKIREEASRIPQRVPEEV